MHNGNKYAVFTIDVERFMDTECVAKSGYFTKEEMLDGLDTYIGILDKYGIKSTMFTFRKASEHNEKRLKKFVASGHELALHGGKEHRPSNELTDEEFEKQTKEAREMLESKYGVKVEGFRAPFFGIDKSKLEILKKLGFKYDSSRLDFSGARYHENVDMSDCKTVTEGVYEKNGFYEYGVPSQNFFGHSFPVSGGGYLRLADWFFFSSMLRKYIKKHNYYVFYLHPFELSDKKIPLIKGLKLYDKVYLKCGHKLMPGKIEQIIKMLKKEGYVFTTFEQLTQSQKIQNESLQPES